MIRAESAESHGWDRQKPARTPRSGRPHDGWKRSGSAEARLNAAALEEKAADSLNGRPWAAVFKGPREIGASVVRGDWRCEGPAKPACRTVQRSVRAGFAGDLVTSAGTVCQIDSLRPAPCRLILPRPTVCDFSTGASDERVCITAACCAMSSRHGRRWGAGCAVRSICQGW
jgi:hypothetical protein